MNSEWSFFIDFAFLSLFLGCATYLKRSFKVFSKYLIPDAIIAGFIGLILGPELLNWVHLNPQRLGRLIYHLMAIGFIALALKDRERKQGHDIRNTGIYIVSTYLLQGIVGFLITLFLANTIYPDLFPSFGLLLPLCFGQGPGQAFSIGSQWESVGFTHGANIGLSIATFGYLWACIGGVILMNYLIKKRKMRLAKDRISEKAVREIAVTKEVEVEPAPIKGSIDKITIQLFLIGIVYLATYGTLSLLHVILTPLGSFGETLASLFWGFHFIIGSLYAILMRVIFDYFKKKETMVRNYPDNYLLERISAGSFDFMITAAIAAISISVVKEFIVPILLVTTIGGIITIFYTIFMCKRIFKENVLEYILALYGMLTGTISTGLALLREIDPNFDTQVAEKLVLGSGVGLAFGFPLMIILNIPIFGYVNNQPIMYLYTLLALLAYLLILIWFLLGRKKNN